MTLLWWATLALAVAAAALVFAPRAELVTRTTIAATPAQVWAWLGQPASYRDWNPFLISMEGELVEGRRIVNVMHPAQGKPMRFAPTVLRAEPARELRWLGRLGMPRLFDGEHYFVLEPLADGGTRLVHGEIFRGVLLWFIDVRRFRGDFERLNTALKQRAEAGAAA